MAFAYMFYSPRCEHCLEANKILENTPYADQIEYLNVHQTEIPSEYKKELTHVPAIITNEGKLLIGAEVRQWALSLIPTEIESFDASAIASFDGNPSVVQGLFDLESYGAPLAPPMTPELEAKINKKTTNN